MGEPTPKNSVSSRTIKAGVLLKYKKRIFKSNWRPADVVLYSNATILTRRSNSNSIRTNDAIRMTTQTTLIIFGRQLNDVPKKPDLPPGYAMEQLLAIGLICNQSANQSEERLSIVFHWFLTSSIADLFEWIVAINAIIPANKQLFTDEELTMALIMSEAAHYNHLRTVHDQIASATNGEDVLQGHGPSGAIEWTLTNNEVSTTGLGTGFTDALHEVDANTFDASAMSSTGLDCSDFDDCSAYASADAFAIF